MKKLVYFVLLLVSTVVFSQSNAITYQAVIYMPGGQNAPGVNVTNVPMSNKNICLQFSFLDASNRLEYQEEVKVKTDEFGMVNITVGQGTQTGGYASNFSAITWTATAQKNLQVSLDATGLCSRFEELSNEPIASVPFANAAIVAGNVTGVVALVNGGTGATTAAGARANLGIGNVDNTSDLNKPVSNATKIYVDTAITGATIVDADATTKGKLQLAGDLAGTAAAPTVPGLALKENIANKSTDIVADAASTTKYPSVKVIKDYVDALNAAAGVADGSITSAKIADATIVNADVAANAQIDFTKLNIQKSNILGLGIVKGDLGLGNVDDTSDVNKPVSTATQTALNLKANAVDLAAEVTRATAAETTLTTNLAAEVTRATAAEATLTTNVTANATAIAAETTRATAAETTLTNNLAAEVSRATAAEALKAPLASPTFTGTVSGITQTMVGLSNVDNTSDANKPVSTATQTALDLKENLANKSTDINTDAASTTKYPSVKLIKDYVDSSVSSGAPDATNSLKGKIQLAGDLTGNADEPRIASGSVTSAKILDGTIATIDIADAAITYAKIQNVAAGKVLGNFTGSGSAGVVEEIATTGTGDVVRAISPTFTGTVSGITKAMVGLDEVDNTSDADKPVSAATQTALDLKAPLASPTFTGTVSGITKAMVGLNNVDNTSDVNKPVSTATQTALNLKEDAANKTISVTTDGASDVKFPSAKAVKTYVDTSVAAATIADADSTTKGKIQLAGDLSGTADSPEISANAITSAKIKDGEIAATDLAANAVETAKIKNANVTNEKLATGIDATKLADGSVTNTELQYIGTLTSDVQAQINALSSSGSTSTIAINAINTLADGKIYVGNASNEAIEVTPTGDVTITNAGVTAIGTSKVVTAMIATNAVTTDKITNANVTTDKIAADAVTTAKIKDGEIATLDIANAAITYAKIQNVAAGKVLGNFTGTAGAAQEIATIGTGDVVRATSPTLVTPVIGAATGTSLSVSGQLTSTVATGTAPLVVTSTTPVANLNIGGNAATVTNGIYTTSKISDLAATTSAELAGKISDETGSGTLVFATSPTLVTPVLGVATATSVNGTTIPSSKTLVVTTDKLNVMAATTSAELAGVVSDETGTGAVVLSTSPTLVTPTLGAATATSVNKVAITAPTSSATLTIADGKTLTVSDNATVSGTNTGDQTITLTGDVTGSGTGSFATTIGASKVTNAMLAGSIDLTTKVTGILPIANGGTGSSTQNFVDLTTAQTVAGAKTFSGNTAVGGTLGVTGNTTLSGTLGVTGATTLSSTLGVTGNTTLSGTLAVTGATTLSSTLGVTGDVAVSTDKFKITASSGNTEIAGTLKIAGGSPGAGKLLVSDASGLASWNSNPNNALTTITTATYPVVAADKYVIYSNAAAGTITLPDATSSGVGKGKEFIIKNITSFGVTVNTTSSQKIVVDSANSAATTATLGVEASNNWIRVISDGTQWIAFRALF